MNECSKGSSRRGRKGSCRSVGRNAIDESLSDESQGSHHHLCDRNYRHRVSDRFSLVISKPPTATQPTSSAPFQKGVSVIRFLSEATIDGRNCRTARRSKQT